LTHLRKINHHTKEKKDADKKIIESLNTILSDDISPKLSYRCFTEHPKKINTHGHIHMKSEVQPETRTKTETNDNQQRKTSLRKKNLEITVSKIMPEGKKMKSKSFLFEKFEAKPKKIIVFLLIFFLINIFFKDKIELDFPDMELALKDSVKKNQKTIINNGSPSHVNDKKYHFLFIHITKNSF